MLDALFNAIDLPASSVRDLFAGENPFDQWASPFNTDHRTSGSRLVSMYTGANPNSLGTTIAGIGAEMFLDPTNLIGGAGILKRMIGARRAMQANAAADAADATRYGFVNPKVFSRAADTAEQVVSAGSPLRPGKYASFEDAVKSAADEYETYFEDPDFAHMLRTGPWGDVTSQVPGVHAARQFDASGSLAVQYEPNGMWDLFDSNTAYETSILNPKPVAGLLPYYDDKVTLHHASPHLWAAEPGFPYGRPRLDKAGTGEGATIRGYGFYAAENPEVVDSYYMHTLAREEYPEGAIDSWLSAHEDAVAEVNKLYKQRNPYIEKAFNMMASNNYSSYWQDLPQYKDLMSMLWDGKYRVPANEAQLADSTHLLNKLLIEADMQAFRANDIKNSTLINEIQNALGSGHDTYLDSAQVIPPNRYTLSAPKSGLQDLMISDEVLGDSEIVNNRVPSDIWEAIDNMANPDDVDVPYPNVDKWWLSESGELVQGLLQAVVASGGLPKRMYDKIPKEMLQRAKARGDNDEIATFLMDQMGIKGNRHLDGLSRTGVADTPTYNHVYWNQDLLNQIRPRIINGVPVPLDDMLPMDKLTNRVRRSGADDEFLMSGSPLSPSRPRTPVPSYGGWATGLGTYNGLRVTTHE